MTAGSGFLGCGVKRMSEPTSTGVASLVGWKAIGGLAGLGAIGAGLASIVVMCLMTPRNPKEWAVGLICTVLGSVSGGSFVIQFFGLQHWAETPFGLVAMIGLVFACGLPAWAIVRWVFHYIIRRQESDIAAIAAEIQRIRMGKE